MPLRPNERDLHPRDCGDSRRVTSAGQAEASESWTLSPGLRWAINVPGGLQVVPGVAWPIALGRGGSDYLFLYLSFEHAFRH